MSETEVAASEQLQTTNHQLQTENMEVHKHPHDVTHKKKWGEYLLEFLMLFLAVFLGFVAENIREDFVEKHREKQYMISLIRDLQNDMKGADNAILIKSNKNELADSIFLLFEKEDYQHNSADLYYAGRRFAFRTFFYPNDGTVEQLKNAGGLRLIKKNNVVDSIQSYINQVREITQLQELEESQLVDYRRSMSSVFDALVFNKMFNSKTHLTISKVNDNPAMISTDKKDINDLNIKIVVTKGNLLSQIEALDKLIISDQALIALIKKEYHLENE